MRSLLIADDHPIFRAGLKEILTGAYPGLEVLECSNGEEALKSIREHEPDVAILDIDMPRMNGLEVTKALAKENKNVHVIILTMYREKEMIRKAMLAGAKGYLLKDFAVNELITCIKKVSKGQSYIGPALETHTELSSVDKKKQEFVAQIKSLSQAELKTLKLVSQNHSTREIAERLFLSEKTIENYRSRICQKLGLPPRNNSLMLWVSENRDLLSATSEF